LNTTAAPSGLGIAVTAPTLSPPESLGKKMEKKKSNNNHEEKNNDNHHDLAGYINGWGIIKLIIITCQ